MWVAGGARAGALLALGLLAACSAAPSNEVRRHTWQEYERAEVRLEASGDHRGRIDLARARALSPSVRVQERIELTAYALEPGPAAARAFLGRHPCSPFAGSVLGDLVAGLERPARLEVLLDLARRASDPGLRCRVLLEAGRAAAPDDATRVLAAFDQVADAGCAWSEEAAQSAIALRADAGRWDEVRQRGADDARESVAWAACRALGADAGRVAEGDACLRGFVARFPGSRKVDDAWYLLAERREASGDVAGAQRLFRRIVDERPDSGRAAAARRRLEALRGAGGAPGR